MFKRFALVSVLAVAPAIAFAQSNSGAAGGAVSGGATGAVGGAIVGGPVGAAVGGVVGATAGAIIGDAATPKFRTYVTEQRVPSYTYKEDVAVGVALPEDGVTYHEVPAEYGARDYRYTVVNGKTVLVEPKTRKIVQIIN